MISAKFLIWIWAIAGLGICFGEGQAGSVISQSDVKESAAAMLADAPCNATECTSTLISSTGDGQWLSFEFLVESCDFELNGIHLKLAVEGEQTENVTISPACLEKVDDGHYRFNSSNCTEVNLNLTPCTLYNVSVKTLFEECEPENPGFQFTVWNEPFEKVIVNVSDLTEQSIDLSWRFSSDRCTNQVDHFSLIIPQSNYALNFNKTCFKVEGGSVIFNSTCFNAAISQCTNYDIEIIPFVKGIPYSNLKNSDDFLVPLYPQSSMTVTTEKFNDKSIKFTWAIDNARCMGYIEEFTLKVVGLTVGKNQSLNVPNNCFNISSGKVTFDTSHPCSNVTVDPCSDYFIEITPKLFSNAYSLTGNNANTSILPDPASGMTVNADDYSDTSIGFTWSLNNTRCLNYVDAFTLNVYNLANFQNQTNNYSKDCFNVTNGSISFDTSNACSTITIEPCTVYSIEIRPIISSYVLTFKGNSDSTTTVATEDIPMTVETEEFNGESAIQFTWAIDFARCMAYVQGFILKVVDITDSKTQSLNVKKDCFNISSDTVTFDTSHSCSNVTINPCTDYFIEITPRLFDTNYSLTGNNATTTTSPGDATFAIIESLEADDHSINLSWKSSNDKCDITGFQFTLTSDYFMTQLNNVSLNCSTYSNGSVSFSTNSNCFRWIVQPCVVYDVGVTPYFYGMFEGISAHTNVTTRASKNMTMELKIDELGSESISFSWTVSLKPPLSSHFPNRCVEFVNDFTLKVHDLSSNLTQNCTLGKESFLLDGQYIQSDTSTCENINILACSNYSLEIVPKIFDDSFPSLEQSSVTASTVPGSDIKASFLSNATGVDWISFTWTSSKPTCQEFVSSYNVTLSTSNIVQQVLVNSECFTIQADGEITYNSSNSCSERITISPCSVYTVEVIPEFYSNYLGASNSFNTVTDPGSYARIENLSSPSNTTDSIMLTFSEPKCKVSANLVLYFVTITTLRDQSYQQLLVSPSCVENGSLTLGSLATCQSAITSLASCSFYNISIIPIYASISNVEVNGASVPAYTERAPGDASVTNFLSNPLLSSSIQLQWRRPKCAHEINEWRLSVSDQGIKKLFSIPYQCPNISGDIFTLSISDYIICANQQSLPGYSVLPCFDYQVQLEANFVSIDSDGPKVLNHTTASEQPGKVTNLTYEADKDNRLVKMTWSVPLEHAQCLKQYQILLKNESYTNETITTVTSVEFANLSPCTVYNATVFSIKRKSDGQPSEETVQFGPIGESDCETSVVGLALGITFAVIFVAGASGLLFIYRTQVSSQLTQLRQGFTASATGASVAGKATHINQFSALLRKLEADGGWEFNSEFKALETASAKIKESFSVAENPANTPKNRYTNVLPYDRTRVKLRSVFGVPNSDYINASFITGFRGQREFYIATQGPTEATTSDFWRAIYEKNVSVIVMVTSLEERGKNKCFKYWPSRGQGNYGEISVTFVEESKESSFTNRWFNITYANETRTVLQMYFTNWPDFGCPEDPADMIQFIMAARSNNESQGGKAPILVHCSAGIGRSGTFIALDMLMRSIEVDQKVNVQQTVLSLRKERKGMVQTEDQYRFIYKCLEHYIHQHFQVGVREPSSQLEARNPTFPPVNEF